jgi:hypothetical protein
MPMREKGRRRSSDDPILLTAVANPSRLRTLRLARRKIGIFVGKRSITNIARHTTFATAYLSESPIRQIGSRNCGRLHWLRSGLI